MWSGINNVTMVSLSLQLAQWNWTTRADARCLQGDGKTLCSFTVVSYHIYLEQSLLIVNRHVDRLKSGRPYDLGWVYVYLNIKKKRESWLIGSLTGAVVFNRVAKYIQIYNFINI